MKLMSEKQNMDWIRDKTVNNTQIRQHYYEIIDI